MDLALCQKFKKGETLAVQIWANKIKNRVTFRIKSGYYLDFLTSKTIRLPEITGRRITKDKNGENLPQTKITEVAVVNCTIINKQYQHGSMVLSTFVPNSSFDQLNISPTNHIYTETFYSEFYTLKYGLQIKILCP